MLLRILIFILALCIGFIYPGIAGALVVGAILIVVFNGFKIRGYGAKRVFVTFALSSAVSFALMHFTGLLGASEVVHSKVEALRNELVKQGYTPKWFIISQKRNKLYNSILANSVVKTKHLEGKAIDLYIIDINDDGVYDLTDFKLIEKAHDRIQRQNGRFRGHVFNYLKKGFFSRRMVHVEVEKL